VTARSPPISLYKTTEKCHERRRHCAQQAANSIGDRSGCPHYPCNNRYWPYYLDRFRTKVPNRVRKFDSCRGHLESPQRHEAGPLAAERPSDGGYPVNGGRARGR
jgi:hypothetical protein